MSSERENHVLSFLASHPQSKAIEVAKAVARMEGAEEGHARARGINPALYALERQGRTRRDHDTNGTPFWSVTSPRKTSVSTAPSFVRPETPIAPCASPSQTGPSILHSLRSLPPMSRAEIESPGRHHSSRSLLLSEKAAGPLHYATSVIPPPPDSLPQPTFDDARALPNDRPTRRTFNTNFWEYTIPTLESATPTECFFLKLAAGAPGGFISENWIGGSMSYPSAREIGEICRRCETKSWLRKCQLEGLWQITEEGVNHIQKVALQ